MSTHRSGSPEQAFELLLSFVQRDLTVRYRHAWLGVAWAILTPFLQMVVFTLIFTRAARVEADLPYPLFAFSGLTVWTLTASALRSAMYSLSGNAYLVSKVAFRREVLPMASVLVATVDFGVTLCMLGGMMWYYGIALHVTALLVPFVLLVQLALTIGLALLLAAANLWWHDVRHVFDVGITVWMFASAVLFPIPALTGPLGFVLSLNPMTPIVEAYRDLLLRGVVPPLAVAMSVTVAALVVCGGGLYLFRKVEPRFAEVA